MNILKIIVLSIFLSFLLLIASATSVKAQSLPPFIKYSGNPLPFHPNYPGRAETGTYQPSVLYENGIFKLWYASLAADGFKLAYADSSDGIRWWNYKLLPITDSAASHNPSILHINNMYELYYTSDTGGLIVTKVTDDTSTRTVMVPEEPWESRGIFAPHVTEQDGEYTMLYTGWGNQGFRIGMATSSDGEIWHKCQNNPILPYTADGSFLYMKDGRSYLFFHSENGIEYVSTTGEPQCNSVWDNRTIALTRGPGTYDVSHMISPSLIEKDSNIYLYYSGLGATGWTLNLATTLPLGQPATIPPTKEPVVIIPGLFASWNKDAMLHDTEVSDDQWTMTPFVKEYDGIIQTLEHNGYILNKDYYIYTYDWRKPVATTADRFNQFMNSKVLVDHTSEKIHFIGHSLGGLVARTYLQRYQPHLNATLVTVGTPHQGAAPAYKAVEGGDIETQNSYEWLAEKLILQLHRGTTLTDREILNTFMPVVKDLLPIYPYLKRINGTYLISSQLNIHNDFLQNINTVSLPSITALGSNSYSTLAGYVITPRSAFDKILDIYPDGRPLSPLFSQGDGLVTAESSIIDATVLPFTGNHGDIISKKDQLKRIFETSNVPIPDTSIVEGASSSVFPGVIGLIMSPARLSISDGTTVYSEENGVVFVPQNQHATYTVTATGISSGSYSILLGSLNGDETSWKVINGMTNRGKIDTYSYTYDSTNPWTGSLTSLSGSDQLNELKSAIDRWLLAHKRRLKPELYRNPRVLIHYLIEDHKAPVILELTPLIEQIEQTILLPDQSKSKEICDNNLKKMNYDISKAENEVLRSRTYQKEKALLLVWLQKRMRVIDRISLIMPRVAALMIDTNREVLTIIR